MKGKFLVILAALFIGCKEESLECNSFKTGVFKMYYKGIFENVIERDKELQLEFVPNTDKIKSISKIEWEDCNYILRAFKYLHKEDNPLEAKVVKIEKDTIFVDANLKNTFWFGKIVEPVKPYYKFVKITDEISERFKKAKLLIEKEELPSNAKSW